MTLLADHPWAIIDRLTEVVLNYVKGCVVEIGIGRSTYILADIAERYGVKFYTCDIRERKINAIKEKIKYENISVNFTSSFIFMETFDDKPAVVFIDGNHKYDVVSKEAYFFLDKLLPGGVVFMHDTTPIEETYISKAKKGKIMDTHLIRKELEKNDSYDVFTWRYTAANCGLTMVLKKDLTEPHYRR